MKELTSFEFYKTRNELPVGDYRVIEEDETVSIAVVKEHDITWFDEDEYIEKERRECEELMWINDGMDLIYGTEED